MARAAVTGDEAALELFDYRPQTAKTNVGGAGGSNRRGKSMFMNSSESLCFLLCGDKGSVYFVNENARFNKLFKMESSVVQLMFNQEKSILIALTNTQMLGQYHIKSDNEARNLLTVKLNGRQHEFDFSWLGSTLLAYVSGESLVRVLDIDKDENFTLALSTQFGYAYNEAILSVTYSAAKGIIAAGTDHGNVAMWKFVPNVNGKGKINEPEASWQLMHAKTLQRLPITKLKVLYSILDLFLLILF